MEETMKHLVSELSSSQKCNPSNSSLDSTQIVKGSKSGIANAFDGCQKGCKIKYFHKHYHN